MMRGMEPNSAVSLYPTPTLPKSTFDLGREIIGDLPPYLVGPIGVGYHPRQGTNDQAYSGSIPYGLYIPRLNW